MSKWKRFLLLGSLAAVLLAGLMFTSHTQGSNTAHASGCNNPPNGNTGKPYYYPTWSNNCQISEGNISNAVYAIQEIINDDSYLCGSLTVDGDFGQNTYNAVKCVQKHFGLPQQDGIVGTETWGVLSQALGFVAPPNQNGWDYYFVSASHGNDFRMWVSSGKWYVNAGGCWRQMVDNSTACE